MSQIGSEYTLAEKPCLDALHALGYAVVPPEQNQSERDGSLNTVLLNGRLSAAVQRLNGVDAEVAQLVVAVASALPRTHRRGRSEAPTPSQPAVFTA